MHTVSDMQGLNFLTKRILDNTAGAICGMVQHFDSRKAMKSRRHSDCHVHVGHHHSGALRAKKFGRRGY